MKVPGKKEVRIKMQRVKLWEETLAELRYNRALEQNIAQRQIEQQYRRRR